jgi:hypothetical protein
VEPPDLHALALAGMRPISDDLSPRQEQTVKMALSRVVDMHDSCRLTAIACASCGVMVATLVATAIKLRGSQWTI